MNDNIRIFLKPYVLIYVIQFLGAAEVVLPVLVGSTRSFSVLKLFIPLFWCVLLCFCNTQLKRITLLRWFPTFPYLLLHMAYSVLLLAAFSLYSHVWAAFICIGKLVLCLFLCTRLTSK